MRAPHLVNKAIPDKHLHLLARAAHSVGLRQANVRSFERFGFSGSSLYRLYWPNRVPYLIKLGPRAKITREYRAARRVEEYFDDLHLFPPVGSRDLRALPYRLIEYRGGSVVELKSTYDQALAGDSTALQRAITAIRRTYRKFTVAHAFTRYAAPTTYGDELREYWVVKLGSTNRLSELFAGHADPVQAFGRTCYDPSPALASLRAKSTLPLRVMATHGDLHPSNVVLSSSDDPRLVDFARADRRQHLLKDFVLMESSLRFMALPRHIHPLALWPIDEALNSSWSCKKALILLRSCTSPSSAKALNAMTRCVMAVRAACDAALAPRKPALALEEKMREYFRCLALVLSGQQQFESFPLIRIVANIDHILETYADDR